MQGVSGALEVLMKDAIRPTIMQTLEVRLCLCLYCCYYSWYWYYLLYWRSG